MNITQTHWRAVALACFCGLAVYLFDPLVFSLVAVGAFAAYRYLRMVLMRHSQRGLIDLLPPTVQNNLLNRSIFDMLCDFWFFECVHFVKLLCRPFFQPIEPDHAIEALEEIRPETKEKYLVKGVVRIMPQPLQQVLLGSERLRVLEEEQQEGAKHFESDQPTLDISLKDVPKFRRNGESEVMSEGGIGRSHVNIEAPSPTRGPSLRVPSNRVAPSQWDRIDDYRNGRGHRHRKDPNNIIRTIRSSINMVKQVMDMWNVRGQVQRVSTGRMVGAVAACWLLLIAQLTLNPKSRRVVIRMLFVLMGLSTILGTVGTTGVLIYKRWHAKDEEPEHLSLPSSESESESSRQL